MGEWKEYKLGEIADIIPGFAFKSSDFGLSGVKVVKIKDIIPPNINFSNCECVDLKNYSNLKLEKFIIKKGDYVVAMTGATIGKIGKFKENKFAYINQRVAKIRAKYNICNDFLYYALCGKAFQVFVQNNIDSNSAQENISANSLGRFLVFLPSINEQKRIASILGSLDDKIDLLHRENETLEAMAETFFRKWFIEDAKEICKTCKISDVIDFNPHRKLFKGTNTLFLEMTNLNTSTYCPKAWYNKEFTSGTKFINGDTLLARIAPCLENGKTAYIDILKEKQVGWGSTEFIVMRPKLGLHPFFAYILAKYQDFRDFAESCMSGSSGRQRVDIENLKNYDFRIPNKRIIDMFNDSIIPIISKMKNNNNEIFSLRKMRDILLHKLMLNEIK